MKMPSPSKVTPKARKRRTRRLWSRPRRPLVPREYLRLPTRETLTYAEAQKFVDVETDGEIHRLNICEPLDFIPENVFNDKLGNADEAVCSGVVSSPAVASVSSLCAEDSCSMSASSKLFQPIVRVVEGVHPTKALYKRQISYFRNTEKTPEELNEEVEYDMDEEDVAWLRRLNELRRKEKLVPVSDDSFETVIDRIEKEAFLLTVAGGREFSVPGVVCEICMDSECQSSNVILTCDTCNMAVHQDCYGIPYLPEGQWSCKKCLKSPNTPIDCCLCPVKDGPLKQTDDGRWAHVLCAFWVPEVAFGSAVYLEPVERIDRVPDTRFQLRCDICKLQGHGACIKCQTSGCDSSFHATCAMKGGLFMKMEAVPENGSRMNFRKTFFCNSHRPVEACYYQSNNTASVGIGVDDDASRSSLPGSSTKTSSRSKSKKSKKSVGEQPRSPPAMPVPTIPSKRLAAIADHLNVRDRRQLVTRIHSYWLLKRQWKNGYPLIQRLHFNLAAHHNMRSRDHAEVEVNESGLKFLKKLRQDLEKVRLLLELIRKREKLKCERIKWHETIINLQLQPFAVLLKHTLEQLQAKDPTGIFAFPVPVSEVPDYLDRIVHPMDFSSMHEKIESHTYKTIDDFEADFQLMVDNCLTYNQKGSPLHKVALKLREQGNVIISAARRMSERADYCVKSGLHRLHEGDIVVRNGDLSPGLKTDRFPEDDLEGKLRELLKRLDVLQVVRSVHNALLGKRLKKEIATCRRKLTMSRQDEETMDGGSKTMDGAGSTQSQQQHHSGIVNSCSVKLNKFKSLKKLSPKTANSLTTRSCRVSIDSRLGQDIEQLVKGRTRNCVRGRLKSADDSLLESSPTAVDTCNSNATIASHCGDSAIATVTRDDDVADRHGIADRHGVSHIRTRQDALNSHRDSKRLQPEATAAFPVHRRSTIDGTAMTGLSVCVTMSPKLNGQFSDPTHLADSSVVTTRSISRRLSLAGQDADSMASRRQTLKRQLSTPPQSSSVVQSPRQRTCGRFHMIAQPIVLADSVENDSSYESSYSMLSDSELSKCNSPDSQNGTSLFTVTTKKKTRSNCSVEAFDTCTVLLPRDVVWAKSKGYPWYPAMIVDPDSCSDIDDSKTAPPKEVLAHRPKCQEPAYLIRFFDKRRNWQWLSRNKLEPLGVNSAFDTTRIMEIKQCKLRQDVRRAYDEATKTCGGMVSAQRNSFSKPQ